MLDGIISRNEARKEGLTHYFTGDECEKGHVAERLVSSGLCIGCLSERNESFKEQHADKAKEKSDKRLKAIKAVKYAEEIIEFLKETSDPDSPESIKYLEMELDILPKTREVAKYLGVKFYYTGVACHKRGHFSKQFTRTGGCVECYKETALEWRQCNAAHLRANSHNRRALFNSAPGSFSEEDVHNLFVKQNGECTACLDYLVKTGYHIDHIMPLSKGGSNWPENLQLLCPTCNLEKSAKLPEEWEKIAENKRKLARKIKNV